MLIDCPACARSYHVNRGEIGDHGRTLICPRCQARWFVDGDGRALEDITTTAVSARVTTTMPPVAPRRSFAAALRPLMGAAACLIGVMVLIGVRVHLIRAVPRTARLYALAGLPVNTRGLEFEKVATLRLDPSTITVSGEIRNVASRRIIVPRMAYEIRDPSGVTLVSWTERPPTRTLSAGETLAFAASPHESPKGGETVSVHFAP